MNIRTKVIFCILTAILTYSICLFPACSSSDDTAPSATDGNNGNTPTVQPGNHTDDYVELVYFHRTKRCYSCQYAGDMTQNIVESHFSDELANGELIFKTLDVQDSANAEMTNKYGAYGSSLFFNVVTDGEDHIQAITDIWFHIGDDDKFIGDVKTEIEEALESI
ncbi:MAG: hypothetical protein JSW38_11150 [Dehalococcoidia bacterium]|nr:MAG: hypothetical protein JSW38_11150 [Dehalococcoidia bacterium]